MDTDAVKTKVPVLVDVMASRIGMEVFAVVATVVATVVELFTTPVNVPNATLVPEQAGVPAALQVPFWQPTYTPVTVGVPDPEVREMVTVIAVLTRL